MQEFDRIAWRTAASVATILNATARGATIPNALLATTNKVVGVGIGDPDPKLIHDAIDRWVTRNAVRDCVESFLLYLDAVIEPTKAKPSRSREEFARHLSVGAKVDVAAQVVGLPVADFAEFLTINQARNCLVHRGGVVDAKLDCGGGDELVVTFKLMSIVPAGQYFGAGSVPRERRFAKGATIHFDVDDLIGISGTVRELAWLVDRALTKQGTP